MEYTVFPEIPTLIEFLELCPSLLVLNRSTRVTLVLPGMFSFLPLVSFFHYTLISSLTLTTSVFKSLRLSEILDLPCSFGDSHMMKQSGNCFVIISQKRLGRFLQEEF